jgi:RNA recognition motif-containing protein
VCSVCGVPFAYTLSDTYTDTQLQTDIARGVTDDMLREKFKDFGNVVEAFVVKNKYTGDTKGFNFISLLCYCYLHYLCTT